MALAHPKILVTQIYMCVALTQSHLELYDSNIRDMFFLCDILKGKEITLGEILTHIKHPSMILKAFS